MQSNPIQPGEEASGGHGGLDARHCSIADTGCLRDLLDPISRCQPHAYAASTFAPKLVVRIYNLAEGLWRALAAAGSCMLRCVSRGLISLPSPDTASPHFGRAAGAGHPDLKRIAYDTTISAV
jgi:hypothetical protein